MPLAGQNIRGVKRKKPHDEESEHRKDKQAKLRRKLYHALRELRQVVKKARTFEIQRTLKKLKYARHKDPESDVTNDLVAQMEILKHLGSDELVHSALLTKLKKDRTLSADPAIRVISIELASSLIPPAMPGTPTAKVQSRILSSKVLASEVSSVVETLRTCLYPPVEPTGLDIREATDDSRASSDILKKRRIRLLHEKTSFSSKDTMMDLSDEGSGGEFENASGSEDDGWESGTVGGPSESADSVVLGGADDDDTGPESSNGANLPLEDPTSEKLEVRGSKGQSEFLPSLAVGFARGDSDSEFSDSEMKLVDEIKKNRRGQRARRAIWEKKFGKNANHVKGRKQQDAEHRQAGSVPVDRRTGKGKSSLRSRRTPMQPPTPVCDHEQVPRPTLGKSEVIKNLSSAQGRSGRKGDPRGKQGEQALHPSWEAKRKQRSANIVPSQGTKIVFSE